MKLINILLEEKQVLTLGDLKFGVNVHRGEYLPKPFSDALISFTAEEQLERYLKGEDLTATVIIDRSQHRNDRFKIPSFEKSRQKASQEKEEWLDNLRTKGQTSGLD